MKQQSVLSTSLNIKWLIHEIETMLNRKTISFDCYQEETWDLVKSSQQAL
ncbi:hypothetical protein STRDD10_00762 [Streptococcus sp. DD10]|nr:hypothetical protein STRDD10_00762 [Streptococcus sp. DD10]